MFSNNYLLGETMKRIFFTSISLVIISLFLISCVEQPAISDEELEAEFEELSDEELQSIIAEGEIEKGQALAGQATKLRSHINVGSRKVRLNRASSIASKVYRQRLNNIKLEKIKYPVLEKVNIKSINCNFDTADELLAKCPTAEERQIIRKDFNYVFDEVPPVWDCTDGGSETSVMLTVFNTFRLMKCIPFEESFPWAPEYDNLYDWVKSLNLEKIKYYTCYNPPCKPHAYGNKIFLPVEGLDLLPNRQVYNPQWGWGLPHKISLLLHEARHTDNGGFPGHPGVCDLSVKDNNLEEMGAWAVEYYFREMLAEKTGNFLTDNQKSGYQAAAQFIYNSGFCDYLS